MTRVGPTEDTPATPSWVEQALNALVADLPDAAAVALRAERGAYLDCLAATNGPDDPLIAMQRCHALLLQRLRAYGLDTATMERLHQTLENLEADFADRT